MKRREEFWSRVQGALDERRDPLDEEVVQEWLLAHPDDGDELARLRGRLARVAVSAPEKRGRTKIAAWTAAALAVAASAAFFVARDADVREPESSTATEPRPPTRVNELRVTLRTTSEGRSTTTTLIDDHLERTSEYVASKPWMRITATSRGTRP